MHAANAGARCGRAARAALSEVEEPYRSRAIPRGTTWYLSWLFAAPEVRNALLGAYALMAEWRALLAPEMDPGVARLKLGWWRAEIERLAAGGALHPVTRYLAGLPHARPLDTAPLHAALSALDAELDGVPLERAEDLPRHAYAIYGAAHVLAARLAGLPTDPHRWHDCLTALASAQYLGEACMHYRQAHTVGRVPFAVAELLAAGIDNDELAAPSPPPRLDAFLKSKRRQALGLLAQASGALLPQERAPLRHVQVIAALEASRWRRLSVLRTADFGVRNLYNAWRAARRAAARR